MQPLGTRDRNLFAIAKHISIFSEQNQKIWYLNLKTEMKKRLTLIFNYCRFQRLHMEVFSNLISPAATASL